MDLAKQQRELRALIKQGPSAASGDPYIDAVAGSAHLDVLREMILSWRRFDIERSCRLTATLLKQRGLFDEAVEHFTATADISPFVERLAEAFLEQTSRRQDPLLAAVARLELYLTKVKSGDPGDYTVEWPTDPHVVLMQLANGKRLDNETTAVPHRMFISHRYSGLVRTCPIL